MVIVTGLSYIPGFDQDGALDRVDIVAPWDWKPTADRVWIVSPTSGIGAGGIFGAIIPGFMFFLLFIIDHNVSSILSQLPKYNLKKVRGRSRRALSFAGRRLLSNAYTFRA